MITISNSQGKLLRVLPEVPEETVYGFHQRFGWTSERGAKDRLRNRQRFGLQHGSGEWLMRFSVRGSNGGELALKPIAGCEVRPSGSAKWVIDGAAGEFSLSREAATDIVAVPEAKEDKRALRTAAVALLALALLFILMPKKAAEPPVEEVAQQEPVVLKIVKPMRQVTVPMTEAVQHMRERPVVKPEQVTRNVIRKEVGFLELLGKKDLSKAVGGRPIELKETSPGAGAGGKEGSGGEMLAGLGAGIHKTTVGNTGVAGLGGIGTKGAGGGQGGYGDVTASTGSGSRISNVALANDLVIEGGLSQAVIQATIAKYLNQIRACYEDGLVKNPGLVGLVSTRFDIGAGGSIVASQVTNSTLKHPGVENCMLKKMAAWQFPKPVGGTKVRVNYPFLLKPVQI